MSSARAWHVSGGGRYHASRHCPGLKNRDDVREGKGGRTKPCSRCLELAGIEDGYRELANKIERFKEALKKKGVDPMQVV